MFDSGTDGLVGGTEDTEAVEGTHWERHNHRGYRGERLHLHLGLLKYLLGALQVSLMIRSASLFFFDDIPFFPPNLSLSRVATKVLK